MNLSSQYSRFDKTLHRVAFGSKALRNVMEDMEATLFGRRWADLPIVAPVFVTSLPRAGTTILLECLALDPSLVSQRYRDMPFVYAPVLWSRLSSGFRRDREKSERAHGDGLLINEDSPEAFEEVFWQDLTPDAYGADGIALTSQVDAAAASAFRTQIKKLLFLHLRDGRAGRYLSKNNTNVARLPVLTSLFPDALVLIPFRDPLEHARSLREQHRRFTEMHAADAFVRDYMRDIGHFEFGALHRPIEFPGLAANTAGHAPSGIDYWLGYWIAAFEYLLDCPEPLFLSYESLCRRGEPGVNRLRERLNLPADAVLTGAMAALLHEPASRQRPHGEIAPELARRAEQLYARLSARCILAAL